MRILTEFGLAKLRKKLPTSMTDDYIDSYYAMHSEQFENIIDTTKDLAAPKIIDFYEMPKIDINLGGAMEKSCVLYNNSVYIIKPKREESQAIVSEYIASKLAKALEIQCQEVTLGFYDQYECCAIKYFLGAGESIHSYADVDISSVDTAYVDNETYEIQSTYTISSILSTLKSYKHLNITEKERVDYFYTMCLFDTVIGNFDRHWGNWGFKGIEKKYELCPLFDHGSSLFPRRDVSKLIEIINDTGEINNRIYNYPTSHIRVYSKNKSNYQDIIKYLTENLGYSIITDFVDKFEKIDVRELIYNDNLLDKFITEVEKEFLYKIITGRFEKLVKAKVISVNGN